MPKKKVVKKKTTAKKPAAKKATKNKTTKKVTKKKAKKPAEKKVAVDKTGWSESLLYRIRTDPKTKRHYFEVATKAGHLLLCSRPYVHAIQARRGGVAIIDNLKRNAPSLTVADADNIPDYVERVPGKSGANRKR